MDEQTKRLRQAREHFEQLVMEKGESHTPISARVYFTIFKLALEYTDGVIATSSVEVVEALEKATPETYKCAMRILKSL